MITHNRMKFIKKNDNYNNNRFNWAPSLFLCILYILKRVIRHIIVIIYFKKAVLILELFFLKVLFVILKIDLMKKEYNI